MYEELDLPPRKSIKKKFQEHKAFKEVIVRVFFAQDCDSMKVAISFRLWNFKWLKSHVCLLHDATLNRKRIAYEGWKIYPAILKLFWHLS